MLLIPPTLLRDKPHSPYLSILNEGFRIGGVGKHRITNGTALGYGIYLAQDGMTSMGYAAGADRIFACRGEWFFLAIN